MGGEKLNFTSKVLPRTRQPVLEMLLLSAFFRMWPVQKSLCVLMVLTAFLAFLYLHVWVPKSYSTVDLRHRPDRMPELLWRNHQPEHTKKYANIAFQIKEEILELLPKNSCKCEVEPSFSLPFQKQLFGHVYSLDFASAFKSSELADINSQREKEYRNYLQSKS